MQHLFPPCMPCYAHISRSLRLYYDYICSRTTLMTAEFQGHCTTFFICDGQFVARDTDGRFARWMTACYSRSFAVEYHRTITVTITACHHKHIIVTACYRRSFAVEYHRTITVAITAWHHKHIIVTSCHKHTFLAFIYLLYSKHLVFKT